MVYFIKMIYTSYKTNKGVGRVKGLFMNGNLYSVMLKHIFRVFLTKIEYFLIFSLLNKKIFMNCIIFKNTML